LAVRSRRTTAAGSRTRSLCRWPPRRCDAHPMRDVFFRNRENILHKRLNVYIKSYKETLEESGSTIQSLQDHGPPG
jgi:hypothetical protein